MASQLRNEPLEESPLVNKTALHSTINPDKLDQSRFTDMRDLEEDRTNPIRIIIYAIIVIAVGVGAAFLVRTLISNNQTQNTPNNSSEESPTNEPEELAAFEVNLVKKNDSTATNFTDNEDYIDSSVVTLGDTTLDMTQVELNSISYDAYTTFTRTTFKFEGNSSRLPKTNVNFNSSDRELRVAFDGLSKINEELLVDKNINDVVDSISYDTEESEFVLILSEDSKYRVFQQSGNLVVDVKTVEELDKPVEETPTDNEEETPAPSTPTTPTSNGTKPAAPFYTNNFSRNQQYISSSVSTNTLGFNNFWIWDEGSFFEFSLGQTGSVGNSNIPNAVAYLKDESSKTFLYLEIENLSNAPFSQSKTRTIQQLIESSGAAIDTAKVNFVQVELVTFASGKATYKIELKNKADFKLLTQDTYDGQSQIVSVQIKD